MLLGSFMISFGMPGPAEWFIILLIILLVVGPKKLPELMRSVGRSFNAFKKGMKETDVFDEESSEKDPDAPKNKTSS